MSGVDEWNNRVIEEFRANGGKVSGPFQPILLLTHKGARSGKTYVNPLVYHEDGGRILIFASKGGFPTNPDWYYNLRANPEATIEVGTDRYDVTATEITGAERDAAYEANAALRPYFVQYQQNAPRKIPVIALTRK